MTPIKHDLINGTYAMGHTYFSMKEYIADDIRTKLWHCLIVRIPSLTWEGPIVRNEAGKWEMNILKGIMTISLIIAVNGPRSVRAEGGAPYPLINKTESSQGHQNALKQAPGCENVLNPCLDVIKAQDIQIKGLKEDVSLLSNKLTEQAAPKVLPTWALIGLSVLAGFAAAKAVGK